MSNPVVIDLSHHNPEPDWDALLDAGTLGVIHKATEGTTYIDDTFADRRDRARGSGMPFLAYHFLRPGSIEAQMRHFLEVVMPVQGERLCLDFEDDDMSLGELVQAVEYLQAQPGGYQVTVYSGHTIREKLGGECNEVLATTSLWIAQYGPEPEWPYATWPTWSLWQYTDGAQATGCSAPVDGNQWNGSTENLLAWLAPAGSAPAPAPGPEPAPTVQVFLVEPDITEIRLVLQRPIPPQ